MTKPTTPRIGKTSRETDKPAAHWLTLATTPAYCCHLAASGAETDSMENRKRVLHPLHQPSW